MIPTKVKFIPLDANEPLNGTTRRQGDVLSRNSVESCRGENEFALHFALSYYAGQGFMAAKVARGRERLELRWQRVCVQRTTDTG